MRQELKIAAQIRKGEFIVLGSFGLHSVVVAELSKQSVVL